MNSRERVLAALNHCQPDRVPVDIGGGVSTSMVAEAYEKLKSHLGITEQLRYISFFYRIARLDENALCFFGSDCRPLTARAYSKWKAPRPEDKTAKDIWGITWRKVFYDTGYYWEVAESPLSNAEVEDIDSYAWPDPLDKNLWDGILSEAKKLYDETNYAILGDGQFKSFWELAYMLRGFENMLMDVAGNPEFVKALLNKLLTINIAATEKFLDAAGPYIQVFRMGDDLATQSGLIMAPQSFRDIIKPVYKKYIDFVKSKTDAKIFFHSCGNVTALLGDLMEVGVDIINPVQCSALGNMNLIKKNFPKISFWGGIDTQYVMPSGSISDVENEVKNRISELGKNGGFVLSAVHAIQPDVPLENVIAMTTAAKKWGAY